MTNLNPLELMKLILTDAAIPHVTYVVTPCGVSKSAAALGASSKYTTILQARFRRNMTIAELKLVGNRIIIHHQLYDTIELDSNTDTIITLTTHGRIHARCTNLEDPKSLDIIKQLLSESINSLTALFDVTMMDEIVLVGSRVLDKNSNSVHNISVPTGFMLDADTFDDTAYTFEEDVVHLSQDGADIEQRSFQWSEHLDRAILADPNIPHGIDDPTKK